MSVCPNHKVEVGRFPSLLATSITPIGDNCGRGSGATVVGNLGVWAACSSAYSCLLFSAESQIYNFHFWMNCFFIPFNFMTWNSWHNSDHRDRSLMPTHLVAYHPMFHVYGSPGTCQELPLKRYTNLFWGWVGFFFQNSRGLCCNFLAEGTQIYHTI